jgi:hypothetical protein
MKQIKKDEIAHIQTSTTDQTINKENTAEGIIAIHITQGERKVSTPTGCDEDCDLGQ